MNKLLFVFFILLPAIFFGQEEEAILVFNDSTQIEGYGIIRHRGTVGDHDVIKFRISSDSDAEIWDETMCSGIFFKINGQLEEFQYVKIKSNDFHPVLLKVFSEGEVMLYGRVGRKPIIDPGVAVGPTRVSLIENRGVTFFVKKKNEEYAEKMWGFTGWKKQAKEYFRDCTDLIEKIESKEFTTKNIPEMVDFYNNTCGN